MSDGDIQRVTDRATGLRYSSMMVAVCDLVDAIKAVPAHCPECYVGATLEVPCDTPLQWEVSIWHDADCSQGAPAKASHSREASGLHLVSPLPGSGKWGR